MIDPHSTSYPTLAVIQAHGITDPHERELIWRWSGAIADRLWRRLPAAGFVDARLGHELAEAFAPTRLHGIRDHLHMNLQRAVQWCKDEAERNANG